MGGTEIAAGDAGSETDPVVAGGGDDAVVGGDGVVGVDEIDFDGIREAAVKAVGRFDLQLVPAHVRNLEFGGGEVAHGTGEDAESGDIGGFFAGFEEKLVADADAEEGSVGGDPRLDGLPEAGFAEVAGAVTEGSLAGNDDRVARLEFGGGGDVGAGSAATFGGFESAAEIAAAVVDDADARRSIEWSVDN